MGFKLKISVKARLDVEAAIDWYNAQVPKLGEKFLYDFRNTLAYLIKHPYLFRPLDNKNREARFHNFPYLIIYKVEKFKVTIIGVFNTHQNPNKKL